MRVRLLEEPRVSWGLREGVPDVDAEDDSFILLPYELLYYTIPVPYLGFGFCAAVDPGDCGDPGEGGKNAITAPLSLP